ncbi:hypothetical protein [Exiguobacterium sp. R-17]|uniref:hypothetical protein n=1 Tax=Exiguobacterium sp. R-17 TaxID=3404054 RepID=UPI003CF7657A
MMKTITGIVLAVFLVASASTAQASEYYKVEPSKGIKAGVYKDGKLIVSAVNRKINNGEDQELILDVKKVKDTLFFTEYKDFRSDTQCGFSTPTYILKMKIGKNKVISFKDTININMSRIATDGKYLYFISANDMKKGDLIRLSSDGKQRKVIESDVEDFWYANSQMYYVKNRHAYSFHPNSLKKVSLDLGSRKLYPPNYCKLPSRTFNNYRISNNGIMYIVRKTKKDNYVFDFYSFKTKKITQHVIASSTTLYNKEKSNILSQLYDLNPVNSEFIEDGAIGKIELFSPGGRTLKTVLTLKETENIDFPYIIRFLRVDIVKREIVFVKGTKLVTKKF